MDFLREFDILIIEMRIHAFLFLDRVATNNERRARRLIFLLEQHGSLIFQNEGKSFELKLCLQKEDYFLLKKKNNNPL